MNGYESLGYNIYPHLLTNFSMQYLPIYEKTIAEFERRHPVYGTSYTSRTSSLMYMTSHTPEQKLYGFQKISETYLNSGEYTAAIDNKATNNTPRDFSRGVCFSQADSFYFVPLKLANLPSADMYSVHIS